MNEQKHTLDGIDVTAAELEAIYGLTHEAGWDVLLKWLNRIETENARLSLRNPSDVSNNTIRYGQFLMNDKLQSLANLTECLVRAIKKAR